METFHFIRPWWLLAIVALVLLSPWLWRHLSRRSGWQKVLAPHLSSALLGAQHKPQRWLPFSLIATAWIISSLALAGPSWERLPAPAFQNERAAVIIMDMSMNTRASDISPDRLTRLRFKALDLLDAFSATEIGLVAYSGDAFTISPLTRDYHNMQGMIPALTPEIMPVPGNYPLLAFTEAHRMVTDAGYEQAEFYWFSAGMSQDDYQEIRRFMRGKGHRVSSLLAGEDQATPIRLPSGDMLRDSLGRLSMAQLNSSLFQRLSDEFKGRTVQLRADSSDIEYILAQSPLQESVQRQRDDVQSDQWLDRGPYLAWLLVPLALYAARKGVLLTVLLLPLSMVLYAPAPALAASAQATTETALRPFSNQQQRASERYQQGEYLRAAELFRDPMMRGNALYRAQQYAAAIDAYQQAEDSAERWYNQGNALAQLGELDAASEAYAEALAQRPKWQQAADNKALVDELRQQQEQEQESDQGNDDGDPASQDEQQDQHADDDNENGERDEGREDDSEQAPADNSQDDSTGDDETELDQQHSDTGDEQIPPSSSEEEQQIQQALEDDQLDDEQRAELEQLLRRVQSDPANLLRNRMQLEAERRQQGLPPRGVRQL